eukprot:131943_1
MASHATSKGDNGRPFRGSGNFFVFFHINHFFNGKPNFFLHGYPGSQDPSYQLPAANLQECVVPPGYQEHTTDDTDDRQTHDGQTRHPNTITN